jgi:predicted Rossmann fold nucleotide-binding protein DprA/Smf involved in DNA uptake
MKSVPLAQANVTQGVCHRGMPQFPGRLVEFLGDRAPAQLWTAGSASLLGALDSAGTRTVALAASVESPASAAEAAWNLVELLAQTGVVLVGGFHSPLERFCLDRLASAGQQAIVFLGRALEGYRVPLAWLRPLAEGRFVLVSACGKSQRRATQESVRVRNDCVAALAGCFLIPYASPAGKTEALCRAVLNSGRAVWTLDLPSCRNLVDLGAKTVNALTMPTFLNAGHRSRAASGWLGD